MLSFFVQNFSDEEEKSIDKLFLVEYNKKSELKKCRRIEAVITRRS